MKFEAFVLPFAPALSCPAVGCTTARRLVAHQLPTAENAAIPHVKSSRPVLRLTISPPMSPDSPSKLSYKQICLQAANALALVVREDTRARLFTIDFPPERSESRAGTLVTRYENNRNMCEKLLIELGSAPDTWSEVGGNVRICDNINPQGGGEYLTDDEVMVGFQGTSTALSGHPVTILINAGVDASTLRQVKGLDNGDDIIVLVNCGLDRMSYFAKLGFAKYINAFEPIYFLKTFLGGGVLFKWARGPWRAYAAGIQGGTNLVQEFSEKPAMYEVEEIIRSAASNR
jgi:hypothetical protein